MNTWLNLLVVAGFKVEEKKLNVFKLRPESKDNIDYLTKVLKKLGINIFLDYEQLEIADNPISYEKWMNVLLNTGERNTEFCMNKENIELCSLDVHIAGLITQLNRLGLTTKYSCSGHNQQLPYIIFAEDVNYETVYKLLSYFGLSIKRRPTGQNAINLNCHTEDIPSFAFEIASFAVENMVRLDELKKRKREQLLEKLLSIPGRSGNEEEIRGFLLNYLCSRVYRVKQDSYGNIIAYKNYDQFGPTVLLSAHMDIYSEISTDSEIIKENGKWTRNKGILGADDRAGVAMILNIIEELEAQGFRGKLKIIFTVEEERGLMGAKNIAPDFLWDVDYGIMLDRRNGGDIVTHSGKNKYASTQFGNFLIRIAKQTGNNFRLCQGGSSDLKEWALHGVDSVNISIGFYNEHTEDEYLLINQWETTLKYVLNVICELKRLQRRPDLSLVPRLTPGLEYI